MLITLAQAGSPKPDARLADEGLPSAPIHPEVHLFETDLGTHALVANGSQIYRLGSNLAEKVRRAMEGGDLEGTDQILGELGLSAPPHIDDTPLSSPPLRALSLAIAQKCNLGCTYCYAQEGDFGRSPRSMSEEVALQSVDLLFKDVEAGKRVSLAFLGGEPLVNRSGVRQATEYAQSLAEEKGVRLSLSITTNGTLLTEDDGEFFERHGFSVTVSLDGLGEAHDRQRPFKSGQGSFARIIERVVPLIDLQRKMQVSARVTVTPDNLDLRETLEGLIGLGFHSVGFSPMLSSPTGMGEMGHDSLQTMLAQMIACGELFETYVAEGRRFPFLNMVNAIREIHMGTHRPYPCGAGAGYMGVSAEGGLSACHRFVENPLGAMGTVSQGVDEKTQNAWLASRHVHTQQPCRQCWARYLCGGGCHHEVLHRGRASCGYIRGWLHYCLGAYVRLKETSPDYFGTSDVNS